MIKAFAGLALCGLALLTHRQVQVWASPDTLWAHAAHHAPSAVRPWVNLGVLAIRRDEHEVGERLLSHAAVLAAHEPARARGISLDIIHANLAALRIRQGRLLDARSLVIGAPSGSTRWLVCERMPTLCAE